MRQHDEDDDTWYGFTFGWRSLRAERVRRARKEYECDGVFIDSDLIPTWEATSPATGGSAFQGFAPSCMRRILPRDLYVDLSVEGDDALESYGSYRHTYRTCLRCALHLEIVFDRTIRDLISTRRNGFPLSRDWISGQVLLGPEGGIPGFIVVRTSPEVCTAEVFQPRFQRSGPNDEITSSGNVVIAQKIVWPVGAEVAYRYESVDFAGSYGSISFTSSELVETVDVSSFSADAVAKIKSDFDPAIAARLLCPLIKNVHRLTEPGSAHYDEMMPKYSPFKTIWDRLRMRDDASFESLGVDNW